MKARSLSFWILVLVLCMTFYTLKNQTPNRPKYIYDTNYTLPIKKRILGRGAHFFNSDIVIKEDEFLIVEAGAKLKFQNQNKIIVLGELEIRGTVEEPVVIDSVNSKGWKGIEVVSTDLDLDKLSFPFYKKDIEAIQLLLKNLLIEKEKISGAFLQAKFANLILKNVMNIDGSVFKVENASVRLENIQIEARGENGVEIKNGIAELNKFQLQICQSINYVNANNSILIINDSLFKTNCKLKKIETLGEVFGEGVGLKKSKLIMSNSVLENTDDDGVEADDKSLVLSYKNKFYKVGDSAFDISGKSYLLSVGDILKSSKGGYSFTDSVGFIESASDFSNKFSCVLLRNNSEAYWVNSSCSSEVVARFMFDVRECFKHEEQCLRYKEDYLWLEKFIHNKMPSWKNISLNEMISYGGEYKDFMLSEAGHPKKGESYHSFLKKLYLRNFPKSKLYSLVQPKFEWHFGMLEIGEYQKIENSKIKLIDSDLRQAFHE